MVMVRRAVNKRRTKDRFKDCAGISEPKGHVWPMEEGVREHRTMGSIVVVMVWM